MSWKLFLYDWGGLNIALFQVINTGTPATLEPLVAGVLLIVSFVFSVGRLFRLREG